MELDGYGWKLTIKGGPGSGNFGHAGRPGLVGGSGSGAYRELPYWDSREMSRFNQSVSGTEGYAHTGLFDPIGKSVIFYMGDGYLSLNKTLRWQGQPSSAEEEHIKNLDRFTQEGKLPENTILYRGIGPKNELSLEFGNLKGATITDYGYMSTSTDFLEGKGFAGYDAPKRFHGVLLRIRAQKGQRCGVTFSREYELILPRGVKMRVLDERIEQMEGLTEKDKPYNMRVLEVEIIP